MCEISLWILLTIRANTVELAQFSMYSMYVCPVCMYVQYVCMYVQYVCMYVQYVCMYVQYVCMYSMYVCMSSMYVCTVCMYVYTECMHVPKGGHKIRTYYLTYLPHMQYLCTVHKPGTAIEGATCTLWEYILSRYGHQPYQQIQART